MSYLVLARKYRPHHFQEMMGQSHVLQALQNALTQQRLHHAYLFTGTRGVGKTTVARIFAKCLNCEQGISSQPCGTCTSCIEIDQGRHLDLLEIDAASRTKVEDTRDLLENVQYQPQRGRFKIYLIDEVHMLSGHSFNALLKTLEEPPPHVKFLLATTDPQRLPVTVLSRCLQFHLKNMLPEQIVAQLTTILAKESIEAAPEALQSIARAAQGSMRDALSILDQAIAYSSRNVTLETVTTMLGMASEEEVTNLLTLLATKDTAGILQKIQQLAEMGVDFLALLDGLLESLHQIAILQLTNNATQDHPALTNLANQLSPEDVQLYYQIALTAKKDLPLAPEAKTGFSMTLLRMLAFTLPTTTSVTPPISGAKHDRPQTAATKPTVSAMNTPVAPPAQRASSTTIAQPTPAVAERKEAKEATVALTPPATTEEMQTLWQNLLPQLPLTGITRLLAQHCVLEKYTAEEFVLCLEENQATLLTTAAQTRLQDAIRPHVAKTCQIRIRVGKSATASPATLQQQQQAAKLETVQQQVMAEPPLQKLMATFSATVQPDSWVIQE